MKVTLSTAVDSTDFLQTRITPDKLRDEINAQLTGCIAVDTREDVVTIEMSRQLNSSELSTLSDITTSHVPDVAIEAVTMFKQGDVIKTNIGDSEVMLQVQSETEVNISKTPGVGEYSSIAAAISSRGIQGTIYIVHPGVYVEPPFALPAFASLSAKGTAGNTILIPSDPTAKFITLSPMCKVDKFLISGSETPGSKAAGVGIYFDGGSGVGMYALLTECIIRNFDTGVETVGGVYGAHTLLLNRVQVAATTAPLAVGIYVHGKGQLISNSVVISGVPVPLSPVALPIEIAVKVCDPGTKASVNVTSIYYCGTTIHIDNDGEVEITLLTSSDCNKNLHIGSVGSKSKLRAVNFNMQRAATHDVEVLAQNAQIDLIGSFLDETRIVNNNKVKINAQFNGTKGGKHYQTLTGDVRIGTVEEPTKTTFGEGQYNVDSFTVLRGVVDPSTAATATVTSITDIGDAAKSVFADTALLFNDVTPGNCLLIGAKHKIKGLKMQITVPTSGGSIVTEYWNGTSWVSLNVMYTNSDPSSYYVTEFASVAQKYHARFGVHSTTDFALYTIGDATLYWVRFRIVSAITGNPELQYVKIHTNSTEINKDGFIEYFGDSRPISKLDWGINLTEPANSSPSNQDVYLSKSVCVGRVENYFISGANDRIGLNEFLPMDIDTSFPVKIKFAVVGSSNTNGMVTFTAAWTTSNAAHAVYRTAGAAPNTATNEKSISSTIAINSANTEYRGELEIDLQNVNANASDGNPDLLWLSITRPNDTYTGNVAVVQMGVFYVKWRDGGHLSSY
tara:strand:- start:34817 stop:37186 length:2370 start_codon:yes stop_codon:yes gene_type:complete